MTARLEPPIGAVGAPEAVLEIIGGRRFHRLLPCRDDSGKVGGVNGVAGAPLLQLLERPAEVLEDPMIDELDLAAGRHDRDEAGNGVDDQPKTIRAQAERVFGARAILEVGVRAVPLDDVSPLVPDRVAAHQEPAERPIRPPEPSLELEGLAGLAGSMERVQQAPEIVGMDRGFPAPARGLRRRQARVVQPPLIEGLGGSVRSGRPGQCGDRVDEVPKLLGRVAHVRWLIDILGHARSGS